MRGGLGEALAIAALFASLFIVWELLIGKLKSRWSEKEDRE